MKAILVKIHWILSAQFGLDLRRFFGTIRGIPRFLFDWYQFGKSYSGEIKLTPCFHDRYEEAGAVGSEYFWQDLLVSQWVYAKNPKRHVDIGSRIDGFVAHVASYREIEVFDVRPVSIEIPGVLFRQADLMDRDQFKHDFAEEYCDSISCLHALEHFGLGRYGDPINIRGPELGLSNMASLLKKNGTLYLSTPIGKPRVEFNANYVFDPMYIIGMAEALGLHVEKLVVISSGGNIREFLDAGQEVERLALETYNLGMFIFVK